VSAATLHDVSHRAGAGTSPAWVVLRGPGGGRWGGALRRHYIFEGLAARTAARVVEDIQRPRALRHAVLGPTGWLPSRFTHVLGRRAVRPRLAASEKLGGRLLDAVRELTDPVVAAIYDDPVAQARALGVTLDAAWAAEVADRQADVARTFRWMAVPTASFADLAGLDRERIIVGGNGTDTRRIRPGPWPSRPTVGIVSAAAPGRGLETLIEAVRAARGSIPDLALEMWLVALPGASQAYLSDLTRSLDGEPWVRIGSASYDRLGEALAGASVLTIPHPPGAYYDVALPVKLFDSAAAGRPLVVTPRVETVSIVRRYGIGVVTPGDAPDDLAAALVDLLGDADGLRTMGARAREVAEQVFDWRVVGEHLADAVLERERTVGA
jgi:glycosyltransferase involved in cell wall biosynthesis